MAADVGIASRLRRAREQAGYPSAAAAARAIGIPIGTYAGHENGSRGIKPKDAQLYCARYKISFNWLMTGKGGFDGRPPRYAELFEALTQEHQSIVLDLMETLLTRQRPSGR